MHPGFYQGATLLRMEIGSEYEGIMEQIHVIEETKKRLNAALEDIKNVKKSCNTLLNLCHIYSCRIRNTPEDGCDTETVKAKLTDKYNTIQSTVFRLYSRLFEPLSWTAEDVYSQSTISEFVESNRKIEGIIATIEGEILMIKLPMLSEKTRVKTIVDNRPIVINHFAFFCESLRAELMLLEEKMPHYPKKNIQYIFVYPTNATRILDSDNHDTKAITDTITSFTVGGDTSESCSFSYQTVRSDNIPSGTYITVSPTFGKSPDADEILTKWQHEILVKNTH